MSLRNLVVALVFCALNISSFAAVGTAFQYQGELIDAGVPANGPYDFTFELYDAAVAGTQVGSTITIDDLPVLDGVFDVPLDFGGGIFDGTQLWLLISVRDGASVAAHTPLAPLQELTPVPYAMFATNADTATNVTNDAVDDADADPTNELQDLSSSAAGTDRTINISGGTGTTFSVDDGDWDYFSGSGLSGELTRSGDVALGDFTDPDGHGLNVQNYIGAKAAVRGADQLANILFAEGMLGVLNDGSNSLGLPLNLFNIGVFGVKHDSGQTGAAVYGWSFDDNTINYGGLFVANGTDGGAGDTNYGIYASASNAATNWAGFFAGNVNVTSNVNVTGSVTANTFVGDGSTLTNLPSQLQNLQQVLTAGNNAGGLNAINLGNVGINTTTPDNRLDVNGKISLTQSPGDEMVIINDDLWTHAFGVQDFGTGGDHFIMASKEGASESAGIYGDGNSLTLWSPGDGNGGQPPALVYFLDEDLFNGADTDPYNTGALRAYIAAGTGAFMAVSDRNQKQNIVTVTDSSSKIKQLTGYTYEMKPAPTKASDKPEPIIRASGLIAQEVAAVLPEAVDIADDGTHYLDYAAVLPLLVEALKEQIAANEDLTARLENIEALLSIEKQ